MTEVQPVLDFASSARTGRRNALPDILGSPAGVSPSDLPLKLAEMSLNTEAIPEVSGVGEDTLEQWFQPRSSSTANRPVFMDHLGEMQTESCNQ
uniref:Uncharacterized protein n=1 Tax=Leptobrachium leishanense TaxID=445787 RepID=A0A8C5LUJ8_9ANUR